MENEDVTRVILAHQAISLLRSNHRTLKAGRGTAIQAAAGNGAPELILLHVSILGLACLEHRVRIQRRRNSLEPGRSSLGVPFNL